MLQSSVGQGFDPTAGLPPGAERPKSRLNSHPTISLFQKRCFLPLFRLPRDQRPIQKLHERRHCFDARHNLAHQLRRRRQFRIQLRVEKVIASAGSGPPPDDPHRTLSARASHSRPEARPAVFSPSAPRTSRETACGCPQCTAGRPAARPDPAYKLLPRPRSPPAKREK